MVKQGLGRPPGLLFVMSPPWDLSSRETRADTKRRPDTHWALVTWGTRKPGEGLKTRGLELRSLSSSLDRKSEGKRSSPHLQGGGLFSWPKFPWSISMVVAQVMVSVNRIVRRQIPARWAVAFERPFRDKGPTWPGTAFHLDDPTGL